MSTDALNALIAHVTEEHHAMRPDLGFDIWRYGISSGCSECVRLATAVKPKPPPTPTKGATTPREPFFLLGNVKKTSGKKTFSDKDKLDLITDLRKKTSAGLIAAELGDSLTARLDEYEGVFFEGGLSFSLEGEIIGPRVPPDQMREQIKRVLVDAAPANYRLRAEAFESRYAPRVSTE